VEADLDQVVPCVFVRAGNIRRQRAFTKLKGWIVDRGRSEQTNSPVSPDQLKPPPESERPESADLSALLVSGGETTLVVVPVDPYVVHCQWEVAPADIESARRALGVGEQECWPVLQFYDVTNPAREEARRELSFAVEVRLQAGNWFVRSCAPDRTYRADLALKGEDGSFAVIASSNRIQTPPSMPSSYADEHWLPIRVDPQQPESATPVRPPINLALKLPSDAPSESAEFPVRLPIDMREEVGSMLAALYGERGRDTLEPPVPSQSPLPIDMREEVRKLLIRLYLELGGERRALAGSLLFMEAPPIECVFREFSAVFPDMKSSAIADLTERNERSFTSGISSRTK
jgi:hypothetical protein